MHNMNQATLKEAPENLLFSWKTPDSKLHARPALLLETMGKLLYKNAKSKKRKPQPQCLLEKFFEKLPHIRNEEKIIPAPPPHTILPFAKEGLRKQSILKPK